MTKILDGVRENMRKERIKYAYQLPLLEYNTTLARLSKMKIEYQCLKSRKLVAE